MVLPDHLRLATQVDVSDLCVCISQIVDIRCASILLLPVYIYPPLFPLQVQQHADTFKYVWVFHVEHMRNKCLQEVREAWKGSK